jgi:hypothetical protein
VPVVSPCRRLRRLRSRPRSLLIAHPSPPPRLFVAGAGGESCRPAGTRSRTRGRSPIDWRDRPPSHRHSWGARPRLPTSIPTSRAALTRPHGSSLGSVVPRFGQARSDSTNSPIRLGAGSRPREVNTWSGLSCSEQRAASGGHPWASADPAAALREGETSRAGTGRTWHRCPPLQGELDPPEAEARPESSRGQSPGVDHPGPRLLFARPRRGGRVVECGGLENRYGRFTSIEGSNPSPSAPRAPTRVPHSVFARMGLSRGRRQQRDWRCRDRRFTHAADHRSESEAS